MCHLLIPVQEHGDILPAYRETPVADLLSYHNLCAPYRRLDRVALLIGMCMDHRILLHIPPNFAYVMRASGANFRGLGFQISFAIGVGGARAICLIGHDQCDMAGLASRREAFVQGLVERAGWEPLAAEEHFDEQAPRFDTGDAVKFVRTEAQHLRWQYPKVIVAPLMYKLKDGLLYQVAEGDTNP